MNLYLYLQQLARTLILVVLVLGCHDGSLFKTKHKDSTRPNPRPLETDQNIANPSPQSISESTVAYANLCKKELGLPDQPLQPWNCMAGKEVPITIGGEPLNETNFRLLTQGKVSCDHPSWLIPEEACINYAFIQERDLSPDTKGSIICRTRRFISHKNKAQRLKDFDDTKSLGSLVTYYQIETVGMIWANMKTGKTCFFDYRSNYGGYIPSPDDPRKPTYDDLPEPKLKKDASGNDFNEFYWANPTTSQWKSPQYVSETDQCIRCHDSAPFIGSPWLQQVYTPPRLARGTPYSIVGDIFKDTSPFMPLLGISTKNIPNSDGKEAPQVCTACHYIGKNFSCSHFAPYSVGLKSPVPSQTVPLPPIWMPPHLSEDLKSRASWDTQYGAHIKRLQCCCNNPKAINCTTIQLSGLPLSSEVQGSGPEICP